jgi:hypothetical protein
VSVCGFPFSLIFRPFLKFQIQILNSFFVVLRLFAAIPIRVRLRLWFPLFAYFLSLLKFQISNLKFLFVVFASFAAILIRVRLWFPFSRF